MTLSALRGRRLVFRPDVVLQGALAHYTAEALLSAPGVLGSLELLLNPTGLLSSMSAGLADLLGLPLAALMAGSPAQVGDLPLLLLGVACHVGSAFSGCTLGMQSIGSSSFLCHVGSLLSRVTLGVQISGSSNAGKQKDKHACLH